MMHAIVYDGTGAVIGVVSDAVIDGQRIKGSNMELLTSAPYLLVEDDPGDLENVSELTDEIRLAGAKEARCAQIRAKSNEIMAAIKTGYTDGEIESWDRQRQGAIDILNGDTTTENAVYVTALANTRIAAGDAEMTITAFAERIKANSDAATALGIATLGKQQGLEARVRSVTLDQVGGKLAAAIAVVEAIVWE